MNQPLFLFKLKKDCRLFLAAKKRENKSIGFVPTMGALHAGHASLIRNSKAENDLTVCSIFVNPAQFNDRNDFEKYPRTIQHDIEMLTSMDCDVLFLPDEKEIYPEGSQSLKKFDLGNLENFLEGGSRPGHFQGVANVVKCMLEIIEPDRLYLGQKDFQQVKVIEKMLLQTTLKVKVVMCPIVREESGLALSSRNVRLTGEQRENATVISRELFFIQNNSLKYSLQELKSQAISKINSIPEARVDYLEFCDGDEFRIIQSETEARHIVCVAAVNVGNVRLLDNIVLK